MADQATRDRATDLLALHRDPRLLTVVNVWDSISAKVVAGTEGTQALATASHSIAASLGYPDGEQIPVDEMLAAADGETQLVTQTHSKTFGKLLLDRDARTLRRRVPPDALHHTVVRWHGR